MSRGKSLRPAELVNFTAGNPNAYVSGDLAIMRSLHTIKDTPIMAMVRTPQYVELGRIVTVTAGTASFSINLIPYELQAGDILVIPQHNYISIPAVSENFDGGIISFDRNPIEFEKCAHLRPSPEDFDRICRYADLLWAVVQRPYDERTVRHLQTAMLSDLKHLYAQQTSAVAPRLSRSEQIFRNFLEVLGSEEQMPRTVKAYADLLCVSPNHLSAIVRKESGRSVMEWLNAHCILRAQVLLRHSNLPVYEIAEQLGFQSATFFSRFFRRETGQTPSAYRLASCMPR